MTRTAKSLSGEMLRCLREDQGQDVVEYALLAGFIGIAGFVALNAIGPSIRTVYNTWIAGMPSLWDPEYLVTSGGS